jgi:hypothetical protein
MQEEYDPVSITNNPNAYSGCQKNVPVIKRFFLQPLMPQFRHSAHYYGKRYKFE